MNNDNFCDVSRYANSEYFKQAPAPTVMPSSTAAAVNDLPPMEDQLELLQQRKFTILNATFANTSADQELLPDHADATANNDPSDFAAVLSMDMNSNKMEDEVTGALSELSIREPIAANQDLVANFFLEGSVAVDGKTISGYPTYGHRTSEERLAAVRQVMFDKYGITTYLPTATSTDDLAATPTTALPTAIESAFNTNETREQYWRRMSRHFIHHHSPASLAGNYEREDPFYMIDLGRVVEQMARWRHCLPMVRPHFAVKCNPNLAIMEVLAALGAGFDCASKAEIHMVLDNGLVNSPDDIIFANPCKQPGDLKAAEAAGVTYVTFDNYAELEKIAKCMPHAKAIIRIKTVDQAAHCPFSTKFGCPLEEVEGLLRRAAEVGIDIYGVSFHVGSGNSDPAAYVSAIRDSHRVFQQAAQLGFNCTLLDIGGGYPGTTPTVGGNELAFEDIADAIRPVLETLFKDVTVVSEPGRYFTAATHALVMNVFATRKLKMSPAEKTACQAACQSLVSLDNAEEYQYYVNDGLYQSFNCIIFDHAHPQLLLLDDGDGADKVTDATATADDIAGTIVVTTTMANGESGTHSHRETSLTGDLPHDLPQQQQQQQTRSRTLTVQERRKTCEPRPLRITTIFGPTCDSMDCILKKQPFPEMRVGDWLLIPDMGSYTTAAGCPFNGFQTRRREFVSSVAL